MKKFPLWYLSFTAIVLIESALYFKGWNDLVYFPVSWEEQGSNFIIRDSESGTESYKLGFRNGDILQSINNEPFFYTLITDVFDKFRPGQIVEVTLLRDGKTIYLPFKTVSVLEHDLSFYISYYSLIIVILSLGIFVLYRKSEDKPARIFFIFTQIFALCLHSQVFIGSSLYGIIRNSIFYFTFPFLGAVLIHFFLCFPSSGNVIRKIPNISKYFYAGSFIFSLAGFTSNIFFIFKVDNNLINLNLQILQLSILWMSTSLLISMLLGIYNFFTVKGTEIHYQYRWIMFGILFGLLPETIFGFFQDYFQNFNSIFPHLIEYIWGSGAMVLIVFFSMALLKYKLWDIELIIKRSLQYSVITVVLIGTYLCLITVTEYFNPASGAYKILGIVFTAFLFIPAREFIQKKVDKFFHREPYNPTGVVLDFENKLIADYTGKNLYSSIGKQIENIFHFSGFTFALKQADQSFLPVYSTIYSGGAFSINEYVFDSADYFYYINPADRLYGQFAKAEFLFPIKKADDLIGCFICGEKKSQRPFSKQDIELLIVLANRSSTIIQMSELYKSEIQRKELIEKERARISRDMHDEIGSGLTQIALLSELVYREPYNKVKAQETLGKISKISRETIDNISEIVWTLNPKNDYLDNLAAYLREYSSDLFESSGLNCNIFFSEKIPPFPVSADLRKNIFLSLKEIFNNIVKHSKAINVHFEFCVEEDTVNIRIRDDGAGFEISRKFTGNGLSNIRKRVEDAHGLLEIVSAKGKGTSITIVFRIPKI